MTDIACENTDRELWRGPDEGNGDFYADSIHVTKDGGIGIDVAGSVIVRSLRRWHEIGSKIWARSPGWWRRDIPRPQKRDDGIPTRADLQWMTSAELAITGAMEAVEAVGASVALTDAVTLLSKARDRVADHVEHLTDGPALPNGTRETGAK